MHVRTLIFIFTLSITGPIYSQTSMLIPRPLVETLKQVSAPLKKVSQALARIKIKNKSQTFYASGFFFGNKETLVTNYHVISPDQKCLETKKCNLHLELVKNELQLSQLDAKAELILVDKKLDLAILRIKNHIDLGRRASALLTSAWLFEEFGVRCRVKLKYLLILWLLVPMSGWAKTASMGEEIRRRNVSDGQRSYQLIELLNHRGEYEVRVFLKEKRPLVPETTRLLLIGRAIDVPDELTADMSPSQALNPHRVTTWFIPTSIEILQPIEYLQVSDDPWDTARSVIQTRLNTENQWYSWVLFESVASAVSFTVSQAKHFFEDIKNEQLELFDLEIRTKHLEQLSPHDPVININRQILSAGWKSIHSRVTSMLEKDYWLMTGAEAVVIVGTMGAIHLGGKVLVKSGGVLSKTKAAELVKSSFNSFSAKVAQRATFFKAKIMPAGSVLATNYVLAKLTLQQQTIKAVSYLQARSVITRVATQSAFGFAKIIQSGFRNIKYVGMAQALQVIAETAARPEDLYNPNPIVMLNKMSSDKDFIANVAYMTNETFWMAGVSTYFTSSLKKRIAICGMIGMFNSIFVSNLIKGETKLERLALDTTWESIIGNLQTQIDVTALQYFEGLAARAGNSKLKLLGYAIAFVDQGVGYYSYAKVTHLFEKKLNDTALDEGDEDLIMEDFALQLIPIMG